MIYLITNGNLGLKASLTQQVLTLWIRFNAATQTLSN